MKTLLLNILAVCLCSSLSGASLTEAQKTAIDRATGAKGVYTAPEDTHKVSFPRTDVKFTVEGRAMSPFLGFSSWAAFTSADRGGVMVMGDIVLLEDEVNPAMTAALDAGLEVTALHNHFFFDSPRVMYMHIGGHGSVETVAPAVKKVLDAVASVRNASASPAPRFAGKAVEDKSAISAPALDAILGVKGESNNGMYKAVIGRDARMHGMKVSKQMGVNTWAAFAGSDDYALVDGDYAMTTGELQGVLKALRKGGINIVAIHNHMTNEEPQYVFLHYWGKGPAKELAYTLRAALNTQMQRAAIAPKEVLFVCEHGAAKSVLAAAELNRMAEQRGLAIRGVYRGTNPDDAIAPAVVASLSRDGIAVEGKPVKVTAADVEHANTVVTFACKLPDTGRKHAQQFDWNEIPSPTADVEAARREIRRQVGELLDKMQAGQH